jgi:hypothetical protein
MSPQQRAEVSVASNRKHKLVLGIFGNDNAVRNLLMRLSKHPGYRDKTFIVANEQIQSTERWITTPFTPTHGAVLMNYETASRISQRFRVFNVQSDSATRKTGNPR